MTKLNCFKVYDISRHLENGLDDAIAYRIGRAYAQWSNAHCAAWTVISI